MSPQPITMSTVLLDPEHVGAPLSAVASQPALPRLIEPATMPRVDRDNGERLVLARAERVTSTSAYHLEGLPYAERHVLLREGALARVEYAASLLPDGFSLLILDGWRPLTLQQHLYDSAYSNPALPPGFVSPPSHDPHTPPPHLTGGTVDLTLVYDGFPLALGTGYDEFTPAAHTAYFEGTPGLIRQLRRLLVHSMRAAGFIMLDQEWWHGEVGTPRWAAITGNEPFYMAAEPARTDALLAA